LEIGELAGLKKAEVETLRSFLSRQNDIYRASFGRRATPHMRQCVFFGTTNAEKGYLRDVTGNRRFWPVKTPGNSKKHSWQIAQDEVLQIWAEALVHVKTGETLFLDPALEKYAKDEQREAMESDEREGLVRDFLDMLLPEDWDTMDMYARRAFLNGSEFGDSSRVGVRQRTSVSNMEIWCEFRKGPRQSAQDGRQRNKHDHIRDRGLDYLAEKGAHPAVRPAVGVCPRGCS
jgi:predicted P-loop ATPase